MEFLTLCDLVTSGGVGHGSPGAMADTSRVGCRFLNDFCVHRENMKRTFLGAAFVISRAVNFQVSIAGKHFLYQN